MKGGEKMKKIRPVLILLALTILALPISAGTVQKISTHTDNVNNDDIYPQIAVDCCGNSYVVWKGYDGNDYEIYWMKIDSSGTPGTAQMISTHSYNVNKDDLEPQIAVDCRGDSYITWKSGLGVTSDVYWVKVDASGTPGTVQLISNHQDNANWSELRPHIGIDVLGNSYVVYRGYDGNDWEIYWVKIDASGAVGNAKKVSTHTDNITNDDDHPRIAVDLLGNSYVSWKGYDGNDWDVYWVKIDSSGTQGTIQKISNHQDTINRDDSKSQIAVDSLGNSYVVWRCWNSGNKNIYGVRVDSSGTPGTAQMISTHADNLNNDDFDPQVAADCYGNFYVSWEGYDGNDWEIYWVKIDSSGTPGTAQMISTHTDNVSNDDKYPEIAADCCGNTYIAWEGYDGNDWEIYWAKIDASGTPGTVQKISTHADNVSNDDADPYVAADCCGNSYVVWYGYDGNDYEIYFVVPS
jgi:hypothetical protein